jgi:hypothetical protein
MGFTIKSFITTPDNHVALYAIAVAITTGLILYFYNFKLDPYKNIERFYFKNSKVEYAVFKFTYAIIMLSFILSVRFLVMRAIVGK